MPWFLQHNQILILAHAAENSFLMLDEVPCLQEDASLGLYLIQEIVRPCCTNSRNGRVVVLSKKRSLLGSVNISFHACRAKSDHMRETCRQLNYIT